MDNTTLKNNFEVQDGVPAGVHVQLSFITGPDRGMIKKIWKRETVLGRSEGDILLADTSASKRHASLSFEGPELVLRDLSSTNGTVLNGGRVWEAVVSNLDEITIGETTIQVTILREGEDDVSDSQVSIEPDPCGDTTRPHPVAPAPDESLLPGVKAVLQVVEGADAGTRVMVQKRTTTIGRSGTDIVVKDPNVSRKHVSIEFMGRDRVLLKDLESRNGTMVNKKRVSVAPIKNGDAIQIGSTVFNFFVSFGPAEKKT